MMIPRCGASVTSLYHLGLTHGPSFPSWRSVLGPTETGVCPSIRSTPTNMAKDKLRSLSPLPSVPLPPALALGVRFQASLLISLALGFSSVK